MEADIDEGDVNAGIGIELVLLSVKCGTAELVFFGSGAVLLGVVVATAGLAASETVLVVGKEIALVEVADTVDMDGVVVNKGAVPTTRLGDLEVAVELLYDVETPIGGTCFAGENVDELDIVGAEVLEVETIMLVVAIAEDVTDGLGCESSGTGII